jgi:hypothetical protein
MIMSVDMQEYRRVEFCSVKIRRPLGRPRRRWEGSIKVDLQEVGGVRVDWMELSHDRERWRALVSTVMNFRVPKCREFLD